MSDMRNIIVLKNLPSNLVEEAIVVVKDNQKIKKYEHIENKKKCDNDKEESSFSDCVTKEAEMVILDYISKIENNKKIKENERYKNRYETVKKVNLFLSIVLFLSLMINII